MIKLKEYFQGEFSKNLLTMVTGTALAQAVPIITSIFLTRLYTPSEIGSFTTFVSLTSTLGIIATLKFEEAIVIAKNKVDSISVFHLSLLLNVVFSSCLLVFFSILLITRHSYFKAYFPLSETYYLFIPFGVFLLGLYQSMLYWSNRGKQFRVIAISKVSQNLATAIAQVSLFQLHSLGLPLGRILGFLISIIQYIKLLNFNELLLVNKDRIKAVFFEYKNFALYSTPNAFLNQLSNNLPLFLIPAFFNMSYVGYYSFSTSIVLAPLGIITTSLQQVFFQEIAKRKNDGENLYPYVLKTYKRLAIIGFFPHMLLFLFSPTIFSFVFGEQWRVAGTYTQYLLPWFYLVFLNSPISSIYIVKGKQREYFLYEALLLGFRAAALFSGFYFFNNPDSTILLYGFVGFIFNAFLIWYYLKISKIN